METRYRRAVELSLAEEGDSRSRCKLPCRSPPLLRDLRWRAQPTDTRLIDSHGRIYNVNNAPADLTYSANEGFAADTHIGTPRRPPDSAPVRSLSKVTIAQAILLIRPSPRVLVTLYGHGALRPMKMGTYLLLRRAAMM